MRDQLFRLVPDPEHSLFTRPLITMDDGMQLWLVPAVIEGQRKYWLHDAEHCWEAAENWLDREAEPYCSLTLAERLEDDSSAEGHDVSCPGGHWVYVVATDE